MRVLFISSHEGFPPLSQLPYRPNEPPHLSSHFFRALHRASHDSEIVGREGERETWNTRDARLEINETWLYNINIIFIVYSKLDVIIKLVEDELEKGYTNNDIYKLECISSNKT